MYEWGFRILNELFGSKNPYMLIKNKVSYSFIDSDMMNEEFGNDLLCNQKQNGNIYVRVEFKKVIH